VRAAAVTAGDWTVHLTGYRVGLLQTTDPPAPGRRALEVIMDVTASPTAQVKALGLSFRASVQLFVASPNGYMLQAVGYSGLVQFEPGATHRASVTFHVPDSFSAGRRGFVLRGGDETADVTTDVFIETTFAAELGSAAGTKAGGSL
jgi:hypothetical protein